MINKKYSNYETWAEMNPAHVVVVKNTRNVVENNNILKGIKTNDTKKITNNE